jgi:hypothetical protein
MMRLLYSLLLLPLLLLSAAELQVSPGNDSLSAAQKSYQPGDVIILAPGEYHENFRSGRGEVTLRAAIPGTAVLRGDVDAPAFSEAQTGIWMCPWPEIPEAVNERDSFLIYQYVPNLIQLTKSLAAWTYDEAKGQLYVRTSDGEAPDRHYLTISTINATGLHFHAGSTAEGVRNLTIEGLVLTGFNSRTKLFGISGSYYNTRWGVMITSARENVVIREVSAFLNGYGIGVGSHSQGAAIENCRAFGNRTPYNYSAGGICIFGPSGNSRINGCIGADNHYHDVCVYSGKFTNFKFAENICCGTLRTKATFVDPDFFIDRCITTNASHIRGKGTMRNSVVLSSVDFPEDYQEDNILARNNPDIDLDRDFADPVNFDFRPQGQASAFIKQFAPKPESATLLFLKQDGDDQADGRSLASALGTLPATLARLQDGGEVYFVDAQQGDIVLQNRNNIVLRGRGLYPVQLQGNIVLENCRNITLERLAVQALRITGSSAVSINQCLAETLQASQTENFRLTHSVSGPTSISACENAVVTANVFTAAKIQDCGWSDYNAYPSAETRPEQESRSFVAQPIMDQNFTFQNSYLFNGRAADGFPVGPYRRQPRPTVLAASQVRAATVSSETANLEIFANLPFTGTLRYGRDEKCSESLTLNSAEAYHNIGLTGLQPGQKYFYKFDIQAEAREQFSNQSVSSRHRGRSASTTVQSFTTATTDPEPRTLHVALTGDDQADGSAERPFRSISRAAELAHPGDTVLIRGGEYRETLEVPVSGSPKRPITFRGAPGEKVIFIGGEGCYIPRAVVINNQHNLIFDHLHLGGSVVRPKDGIPSYGFLINDSSNITLSRILLGGIGTWTLSAANTPRITLVNCAKLGGHEGLRFTRCNELVIRNCTFVIGFIGSTTIFNYNGEKAVFENNVVTDNLNMKGLCPVLYVHNFDTVIERNNCFYMRTPESDKPLFGYNIANGQESENRQQYLGREQVPYPVYLERLQRERTSFFANPDLALLPELKVTYKSIAEQTENWSKFKREAATELHNRAELTFADFFARNPEVLKRGCGIQPEAFD